MTGPANRGPHPATAKLKSLEELDDAVRQQQAAGRQVVFANGCFDLIHVGHIRYLEGARAEGDLLVVAINSDASVRKLKGADRPLMPVAERAEIVAGFEAVDYVLVFDEETVDSILRRLRPDVHAKGTDYTEETVPERETVLGYGGRIAIVGDPKDRSTKGFVERIRGG